MAVIAPTPIDAGPAVPSSADSEVTFDAAYEAFNAWEKNQLQPQANALASNVFNNAREAVAAATTATTKAEEATTAAGTATTKAGDASTSASAAESAKIAAEAAFDSFDDRYLGQKSSNPTADNDGGALLDGALYFRTTSPTGMKVWTGTAWDDAYANLSSKFDKTGGDVDGNINITGGGRRITGDFSNATIADRLMFQTNSVNGFTHLRAIPNGTGNYAEIGVASGSDHSAAVSTAFLSVGPTEARLSTNQANGGVLLPLVIHVGGAERLCIDPTTGNVGIGTSVPANKFVVSEAGEQGLEILPNAGGAAWIYSFNRATASDTPLILKSSTLVFNAPSARFLGEFGYGPGAGGTVTQATSKSTAVTLNKPSGRITMHNATLNNGGSVTFELNNTLINTDGQARDVLIVVPYTNAGYRVEVASMFGGTARIRVTNVNGAALSDALVISFAIIKGELA